MPIEHDLSARCAPSERDDGRKLTAPRELSVPTHAANVRTRDEACRQQIDRAVLPVEGGVRRVPRERDERGVRVLRLRLGGVPDQEGRPSSPCHRCSHIAQCLEDPPGPRLPRTGGRLDDDRRRWTSRGDPPGERVPAVDRAERDAGPATPEQTSASARRHLERDGRAGAWPDHLHAKVLTWVAQRLGDEGEG